jgi:hypothetical protein
MARNDRAGGVATPGTFFAPYNLWLGMNERALAMLQARETRRFPAELDSLYSVNSRRIVRRLEATETFDAEGANRAWWDEAFGYARSRPSEALAIVAGRVAHFFRPWPNRAVTSSLVFLASAVPVGFLYACAGSSLLRRRDARQGLLLLPMLASLAASLPFIFHLRFRYPVFDPLLIVLAAPAAEAGARRLGAAFTQEGRSRIARGMCRGFTRGGGGEVGEVRAGLPLPTVTP